MEGPMRHHEPLPDIRLYFSGLLIFCAQPSGTQFQVGIPKVAPGHLLTFDIKKIVGGKKIPMTCLLPDSLPGKLFLNSGAGPSRIELKGMRAVGEPRPGSEDVDSFRWLIDIERGDGFDTKLTVDEAGFLSILTINTGLYFTARLSTDKVKFTRGGSDVKKLDKVPLLVAGDVAITGDMATLTDESGNIICPFPKISGTTYEISIALTRPEPHHPDNNSDFDHVYKVIGTDIPDPDKLKLELDGGARRMSSPDARCTSPNLSVTPRLV